MKRFVLGKYESELLDRVMDGTLVEEEIGIVSMQFSVTRFLRRANYVPDPEQSGRNMYNSSRKGIMRSLVVQWSCYI